MAKSNVATLPAKEKEATQILNKPDPKKHSVLFHEDPTDPHPLFKGLYLTREAAKTLLGVDDLDKVVAIQITVSVIR
jgi:hypothetical protein